MADWLLCSIGLQKRTFAYSLLRMPRSFFLTISFALAACSSGSDQPQQAPASADTVEASKPIKLARRACQHLQDEEMDVGISNYEACLGEQANLTRPANQQLCKLAKSTMSASGVCVVSE